MLSTAGLANRAITSRVKIIDAKFEFKILGLVQKNLSITWHVGNADRTTSFLKRAGFFDLKRKLKRFAPTVPRRARPLSRDSISRLD